MTREELIAALAENVTRYKAQIADDPARPDREPLERVIEHYRQAIEALQAGDLVKDHLPT